MNTVIIIGKLTELPVILNQKDHYHYGLMKLAVTRLYPENNGQFVTDYFEVILCKAEYDIIKKNCTVNHKIIVRGRLETFKEKLTIQSEFIDYNLN